MIVMGTKYIFCVKYFANIFVAGNNKHICTLDRDEGGGGNKTEETGRDSE